MHECVLGCYILEWFACLLAFGPQLGELGRKVAQLAENMLSVSVVVAITTALAYLKRCSRTASAYTKRSLP